MLRLTRKPFMAHNLGKRGTPPLTRYSATSIADLIRRCITTAQTQLRYHPEWCGSVTATAQIKQGQIVAVKITTDMTDRIPRPIGDRVDKAETNKAGMQLWSKAMLLQFEEKIGQRDFFGEIGGSLAFSEGALTRIDAREKRNQLVPVVRR